MVESGKRHSIEERPSKEQYYLNIASVVAERATCPRLHVGAVIVKNDMIISTGYNGAPRGLPHCIEEGCDIQNGHCVRTLHAEINSILQAAYHGHSTKDAALFTNYLPCENCAKAIINSGIILVVFSEIYNNVDQPKTRELFRLAGIGLIHFQNDSESDT
ncbi:dCMP deaminase family protein [Candidatus Woesebacteria bacterium]|nr:dCMP deaminase family protein [Candidatus Woesebacteria bacterium]